MQSISPIRQFKAHVTENRQVAKGHFLMGLRPRREVREPKPGQFYMVGSSESNDPLLKRPFCFFKRYRNSIQILYRVRGKGTSLLSRMKPGDILDVVGPLGNSWPKPGAKNIPLLVAGGIGIASIFPLAASLKTKPMVIYGGKNRDELLMLDELKFVYSGIHPATEDGTFGKKGTVMDVLKSFPIKENHVIYTCGPKGMLKAVAEFAEKKGLKGYASLEEKMACGMGACLGCAVKTKKGIKEVCIDGPVFKFEDIEWEQLKLDDN